MQSNDKIYECFYSLAVKFHFTSIFPLFIICCLIFSALYTNVWVSEPAINTRIRTLIIILHSIQKIFFSTKILLRVASSKWSLNFRLKECYHLAEWPMVCGQWSVVKWPHWVKFLNSWLALHLTFSILKDGSRVKLLIPSSCDFNVI